MEDVSTNTYENMKFSRELILKERKKSGLKLPVVSLGLWHNFGTNDNFENMKQMCFVAFNNGIILIFKKRKECWYYSS
ncbi:hypothetical protein [Acetivibrio ethanolgignens]|uniref:NADP-dependent oxidoreductase domain-containing protein n=1 Tax=Acetivibrio ethanolgignens TaxID=290052 RepID=A0A0V8QC76_9FIRM|nr:hypothetical protein ASU35_13965 [Acetivibrio ethanolgignens]